jgi:hypothetical protein
VRLAKEIEDRKFAEAEEVCLIRQQLGND